MKKNEGRTMRKREKGDGKGERKISKAWDGRKERKKGIKQNKRHGKKVTMERERERKWIGKEKQRVEG